MSLDKEDGSLVRPALGRTGFLGELYDARNESFSSVSLFSTKSLQSLIKKIDFNKTEIDYKFTETLTDRFNLLNIEGDIQLCLISGLVNVQGSGKFLKDEKESSKSVSCSLIYKVETLHEKLYGSLVENVKDMDLSLLKQDQFTHLVTEIVWGANCILSLEAKFESDSNKLEVQGNLKNEVQKILSYLTKIQGKCTGDYANNFNHKFTDIKININADILPEGNLPISVESFGELVSELPNLIKKSNNGKGKPLTYIMIPLSDLRKMAKLDMCVENVIQKIDKSFLISTIFCFEEISSIKLKLSDWVATLKENEQYVTRENMSEARQQYENLKQKESSLKDILANSWVAVRSGSKTMRDLIREVENFKSRQLQLFDYEEYLNSCSGVLDAINEVKMYTSKGVKYLGRGNKLGNEFLVHVSSSFVVLVKSKKFRKANPELHQATCIYFLSLIENESENRKYVVVDLDFEEEDNLKMFQNITETKCMMMKEGKIIKPDMFEEYLIDTQSSFAKIKNREEIEQNFQKFEDRTILEMTCPGWKLNTCSLDKQIWMCFYCKQNIEYNFRGYFICGCGKAKTSSYEFRCKDYKHGPHFIQPSSDFLYKELSALKRSSEMNILILGQTGVGKSTWINSIVNYMKYESLEEAQKNGVICTIPIKFPYFDSKSKQHTIELGNANDREVLVTGQSATQYCSTYSFYWNNRLVRLIDTPGIGDVRGIDKDKENMRHIVDYIGLLEELHGVCILLKANESKFSASFCYSVKEILVHLHKDIAKNVVFCITNARNSFYSPGSTSVLLSTLLKDLGITDKLSLANENTFCLDNEAFLFLCILQYPEIQLDKDLIDNFDKSWNKSVGETNRLLQTISDFQPHLLLQTVSLCSARNKIILLSKPLAEISKNIQYNVRSIEHYKNDLETNVKTLKDLEEKLYYDEVHLETERIEKPRTVCTNASCVKYHKIKSLNCTEIEYKTHCHVDCQLKGIVPFVVNDSRLKGCTAMNFWGNCHKCECNWSAHMHVMITQKTVVKQAKSKLIEDNINKEMTAKEKKEKLVEELEEKIKKYKKEQEIILKISVKMGMFLKKNAISVYNDALGFYLKCMIDGIEKNPCKTPEDEKMLEHLKETLRSYEKEIEILRGVVEVEEGDPNPEDIPKIEDIEKWEKELYSLELTGKDIKNYVETQKSATLNCLKYSEVHLEIPVKKHKENKLVKITNGTIEQAKQYFSQKKENLKKYFN